MDEQHQAKHSALTTQGVAIATPLEMQGSQVPPLATMYYPCFHSARHEWKTSLHLDFTLFVLMRIAGCLQGNPIGGTVAEGGCRYATEIVRKPDSRL